MEPEAFRSGPEAFPTGPAAFRSGPGAFPTGPAGAVLFSTLQVLIRGPPSQRPLSTDQEPDLTGLGTNPEHRVAVLGDPCARHAEAARPKGPAALGCHPWN